VIAKNLLHVRLRRSQSLLVGLALCLLAVLSLDAQAPAGSTGGSWRIPSTDAIRALLAERMAHDGVGLIVGVIEPAGRRVIPSGKSGAPDGRPLDGDSIFQIGSLTKVFIGLLLADMTERGEVALEDPASKYLPSGVTMPERGRPITLIDLSKHWSGLPSMPTNFTLEAEPNPYEAYGVEQLYEFLSSHQLAREPGTQEYSNLGVALLGRLLARRAGLEYEELLQRRVLQPLNMSSTAITLTADQRRRAVPGHDRFRRPVDTWYLKTMPASGSLWSSANDLLRFMSFSLGEHDTPLRSAMLLQRVPGRALGWGASRLGGDTVYNHEGGKEGYRSAAVINPRTRTGVVVLMNSRSEDSPLALARHLLFSQSPLPPAPSAPAAPRFVTLTPAVLDAAAGEYELESRQRLRIARRADHLLVDTPGDGILTFFPTSERDFVANTSDQRLTFERNSGGLTTGLVLHSGGKAVKGVRVRSR
jgi:CubicO group peptidase (beta-lactamase class C family)